MSADVTTLKDEVRPTALRGNWIFQRAMWGVMAAFLALAAIGILGTGPVSRHTATVGGEGGLVSVDYPRWNRLNNPERITLTVQAPEASGDTLRVTIPDSFASRMSISDIDPPPDSTGVGGGQVYEWQVDDWSQPVSVDFSFTLQDWLRVRGQLLVQAGDGAEHSVRFSQFVFP